MACSPGFDTHEMVASSQDSQLQAPTQPPDEEEDIHPPPDDEITPLPVIISKGPQYCSQLDLVDVQWPTELGVNGQAYLGLALNMTGSFEGRSGWANLSDNFDGMGFSIGLLQQNLGMGSLQPILVELMAKANQGESVMIGTNYLLAMKSMLNQWHKDKGLKSASAAQAGKDLFSSDESTISQYDYAPGVQKEQININSLPAALQIKGLASANKNSVNWSLKTIYTDGGNTFKKDWDEHLTNMAQSKPYISLQLKYAMALYSKAFQYFQAFKLNNLNQFLLMFDFVVQNGGFKKSIFTSYMAKLQKNPKMTEQEKSLLILELRLKDVIPRWRNDVISRKKAIIFSEGHVHGVKRFLKQEYCYDPNLPILTQP